MNYLNEVAATRMPVQLIYLIAEPSKIQISCDIYTICREILAVADFH